MTPLGDINIIDDNTADIAVKDLTDAEFSLISAAQARKNKTVVAAASTAAATNLSEWVGTKKLARETSLNSSTMYGIETAQACYNNSSPEDQAKLRKITKYEKNSMILLTPEGKELFRSHGMLKPTSLIGKDSFKNVSYNNGIVQQTNIEAQWRHWFDAPWCGPESSYDLRSEVLQASGMWSHITAGSMSQWDSIYKLFSGIDHHLNEEKAGMQVARQMMGISWWIWTNEKTPFGAARRYNLDPGNCGQYQGGFVDGYTVSVVGLENLRQAA